MDVKAGFAIKKLGESNYNIWKTDIVDVLLREDLWFVVCEEDKEPAE